MLERNKTQMSRISALLFSIACLIIGMGTAATAHAGATLDRIRTSASLPCGVNTEEPEYSTQDAHGNHVVLDLDICKAVAVAVLGPNAKFTVKSFRDEQDALKALKSGEIALLATGSPNFINTANKGYGFARKLQIPLVRVGFPIHDRVDGPRLLHIGYRGAQQLFDRIINAVIAAAQDASPVGYSYM